MIIMFTIMIISSGSSISSSSSSSSSSSVGIIRLVLLLLLVMLVLLARQGSTAPRVGASFLELATDNNRWGLNKHVFESLSPS